MLRPRTEGVVSSKVRSLWVDGSVEDRLDLLMWMDAFPMWTVAVGGEAII